MSDKTPEFFVGYLSIPPRLRRFLIFASAVVLALFLFSSLLIGSTQDEQPASGFRFDYGRQTVTGVIELTLIRCFASRKEMSLSNRVRP